MTNERARDASASEQTSNLATIEEKLTTFSRAGVIVCLLGTTGLLMNRMSKKARESLLTGTKRDPQQMKHDMLAEFRDAPYRMKDGPTLLGMPAGAFKAAIANVTVDMSGISKASVERLVQVPGYNIPIWGIPYLHGDHIRQAGINRTPDIRTRAYLPEWAARVEFVYITPALLYMKVLTLIANAGLTIGIGDGRQEKGARNHGLWEIVDEKDPRFLAIIASGGREAQEVAMEAATPYDDDTRELLAHSLVAARKFEVEKEQKLRKAKSKLADVTVTNLERIS